jgi:hypothetical protein
VAVPPEELEVLISYTDPEQPLIESVSVKCDDVGVYTVAYTCVEAGQAMIDVKVRGIPIDSSPFLVPVRPGRVCGKACIVHGPGLQQALCGHETMFIVQTFDRFQNPLFLGGEVLSLIMRGGADFKHTQMVEDITCYVEDRMDGSYLVSYTPRLRGKYVLGIGIGPQQESVADSPYQVRVEGAKAAKCQLVSLPESFVVGSTVEATVHMYTESLARVALEQGGSELTVNFESERVAKCVPNFTVAETGKVLGEYVLRISAPIQLEIIYLSLLLRGKPIDGSPFRIVCIPAAVDPSQCNVFGPGLERTKSGARTGFTLQVYNLLA